MAYPELVSRGVSERRKCKWLVRVSASNGVIPLIKKIMAARGVSGQPENPPGYATGCMSLVQPVYICAAKIIVVVCVKKMMQWGTSGITGYAIRLMTNFVNRCNPCGDENGECERDRGDT